MMHQNSKALVLIRTPFQAWLCEKVLKLEGITEYDLVYFTQNASPEDRHYYEILANRSSLKQFCYIPRQQYDILNHYRFNRTLESWTRSKNYETIVLASIDSLIINSIATINRNARLVTLDDGLANLYDGSSYYRDNIGFRSILYRHLFKNTSNGDMRKRIDTHYTLHPDLDNIVDSTRLRYVHGWRDKVRGKQNSSLRFFLGGPFEEDLSNTFLEKLTNFIETEQFDYYVRHPRESNPLGKTVPYLDKKGKIAEDAIMEAVGGRTAEVVGWLSSALINLQGSGLVCTVLLFEDDPRTSKMSSFATKCGCRVKLL